MAKSLCGHSPQSLLDAPAEVVGRRVRACRVEDTDLVEEVPLAAVLVGARHRHDGSSRPQTRVHEHLHAVDVKKRQGRDQRVVLAHLATDQVRAIEAGSYHTRPPPSR